MRNVLACLVMIGGIIAPLGAARAEMDARSFLAAYDAATLEDQHQMLEVLANVEIGLKWANALLAADHQERLYCTPPKLTLTAAQDLDMLRRVVNDDAYFAIYPYGMVLLHALIKTYQCP